MSAGGSSAVIVEYIVKPLNLIINKTVFEQKLHKPPKNVKRNTLCYTSNYKQMNSYTMKRI